MHSARIFICSLAAALLSAPAHQAAAAEPLHLYLDADRTGTSAAGIPRPAMSLPTTPSARGFKKAS